MENPLRFPIIGACSALLYVCAYLIFDFPFRTAAIFGCLIGGMVFTQLLRSVKLHVVD